MKTPRLTISEAEDSESKGDTFKSVVIIYMYMCGYVYTRLLLNDILHAMIFDMTHMYIYIQDALVEFMIQSSTSPSN